MTALLTGFDDALKTLYSDRVPEIGHKNPPVTWAMLKKTTGFKGRDKSLPLQIGRTQGSHNFVRAQTRARASAYARFLLTRGTDYHVVQMDGEAMEAAKDEGAVVDYLERETTTAMDRIGHRLNRNLFRNEGMAQFEVLSGSATVTITVTTPSDLVGVDLGDFLESSTDDGTGGAGITGTLTEVIGIDREAGTLTAAAAWNANGWADADFAFLDGDYGLGFFGMASWFPLVAPTAGDSFFSRDRSNDPVRLAGQRFTAVAGDGTIDRFLKRACTAYSIQGGTGDICIINPVLWDELDNQLGAKVRYGRVQAQTSGGPHATVGFDSIQLVGQHQAVNVVADRDCPLHDGYVLDLDCFWWEGLGEAPRYLSYDGMGGVGDKGAWLRISNEDAIEGRIGCRGQFASDAPGRNARLSIPANTVT